MSLQAIQERSNNDRKLNEWSLSNTKYIRKSLVGPKIPGKVLGYQVGELFADVAPAVQKYRHT